MANNVVIKPLKLRSVRTIWSGSAKNASHLRRRSSTRGHRRLLANQRGCISIRQYARESKFPARHDGTPIKASIGVIMGGHAADAGNRVIRLGVAHCPSIRLFREMPFYEVLVCGMNQKQRHFSARFRFKTTQHRKQMIAEAEEGAQFEHRNNFDLTTSLPYGSGEAFGDRQSAGDTQLISLLGPAAGMNPQESDELIRTLSAKSATRIRPQYSDDRHHMQVIMGICDRIYVLNYGGQIADGTPEEIQNNPAVIGSIFGGG